MVSVMDTDWTTWQNSLTGTNVNAIKPIAPVAQSYAPVTGTEISNFVYLVKNDITPATAGGYQGISFWDTQERNTDMDNAVKAATIGPTNNPPVITTPPASLSVTQGLSATFTVVASGTNLTYQWLFNQANIAGATASSYTIPSVQPANGGPYSVVVSNAAGTASSGIAFLSVLAPLTNYPVVRPRPPAS